MRFTKAEKDTLERLRSVRRAFWSCRVLSHPEATQYLDLWERADFSQLPDRHNVLIYTVLPHRNGDVATVRETMQRMGTE